MSYFVVVFVVFLARKQFPPSFLLKSWQSSLKKDPKKTAHLEFLTAEAVKKWKIEEQSQPADYNAAVRRCSPHKYKDNEGEASWNIWNRERAGKKEDDCRKKQRRNAFSRMVWHLIRETNCFTSDARCRCN